MDVGELRDGEEVRVSRAQEGVGERLTAMEGEGERVRMWESDGEGGREFGGLSASRE